MFTLFHHPFCPHSRFIRLALGEHGLDVRLVEERAWERREAFLALNPAGTTPVLIIGRSDYQFPAPESSPNISTRPMAPIWANGGCCHRQWASASRCAG